MKKETISPLCRWTQGYVCAVCTLIQLDGQVETGTREMYSAGVGKDSLKQLKAKGVDSHDLEVLKKHWKELRRKM